MQKPTLPSSSEPTLTHWGSRPPATYSEVVTPDGSVRAVGEVADAVKTLSIAFPKMQPDFWALLTSRFRALGYSRERLQYILHIAIDSDELINQYRFGSLCIADILSISKPLDSIDFATACDMKADGRTDLVWVKVSDKKSIITTREAAEFANLQHTQF